MIVGDLKSLQEIAVHLDGLQKILVLGCGSCVTVCRSGGEKETRELASLLSHPRYYKNNPPEFMVDTIERQCEQDLVKAFLKIPEQQEAILSLACGVGVQTLADCYTPLPVFPALNTTFMGGMVEPGIWQEQCRGCGDCILSHTGGICPVSRCAKSLFNGPCGGSVNGFCEINPDLPCAWLLIFHRLKEQDKLHLLQETMGPRDWRPAGNNGPREHRRIGIGRLLNLR